jgi:Protein of unknown function (DUF559)
MISALPIAIGQAFNANDVEKATLTSISYFLLCGERVAKGAVAPAADRADRAWGPAGIKVDWRRCQRDVITRRHGAEGFAGRARTSGKIQTHCNLLLHLKQKVATVVGNADAYRRDRRKDALLQQHGYFVLRFLAEDAGKQLDCVLDAVLAALARRLPTNP